MCKVCLTSLFPLWSPYMFTFCPKPGPQRDAYGIAMVGWSGVRLCQLTISALPGDTTPSRHSQHNKTRGTFPSCKRRMTTSSFQLSTEIRLSSLSTKFVSRTFLWIEQNCRTGLTRVAIHFHSPSLCILNSPLFTFRNVYFATFS